jgi:hypothetical protein
MTEPVSTSIQQHFGTLRDPRIDRFTRHELLDILVIAICAVICGADDWVELRPSATVSSPGSRPFSICPTASRPMTPSVASLPVSIPPSSRPASCARSGLWMSCSPPRWWPSMARNCAAPSMGSWQVGHLLGQCLGQRPAIGFGPGQGRREIQRDHCHPRSTQRSVPARSHRDE